MLFASIAVLGLVVLAGMGLGALYMLLDRPPARLRWPGALHALGGVAGFELLVMGLRQSPPTRHAVKMGVSAFGIVSGCLIGAALLFGLLILFRHLSRRAIPLNLVAVHGMLAVVGYTLLVTYLTMLH
jgi:hypothetical protein